MGINKFDLVTLTLVFDLLIEFSLARKEWTRSTVVNVCCNIQYVIDGV
jgi:hypothetical protein